MLCASSKYLRDHGAPAHPQDLGQHPCIIDKNQATEWRLEGPDGPFVVVPHGRLAVNNADTVKEALLAGLGIGLCPTFMVGVDLARHRLVPLLPDWRAYAPPLSIVQPTRQFVPRKVRVFIDMLTKTWTDPPPWDTWAETIEQKSRR